MTDPLATPGVVHTTREIEGLIPHRWPFLMVDRIVEYDPEHRRIVGLKAVTATEWFFQATSRGCRSCPACLEAWPRRWASTWPGGLASARLFAGIEDCRFKRVVQPGDTLRLK
jgi:3-hydroxyacyl-[acyl-carrier-protein] dehydratase